MFLNGSLFTSHQTAWNELWSTGRVDVRGNETIAKITYASLYYILSSLPQKRDDKWPFIGLSPGGLAHGHSDVDYNGHVFWDQDTWMFPAILFLHADISKILVSDRIRTLAAAKMNADLRGYSGAMYPWESAYSGLDVTPSRKVALYEHHITGDVAMAFKQYIMATNDTNFLEKERGAETILSIAKFWSSRVVLNNVTKKYEIQDVMPPDEWHFRVNNSAYTNTVAKMALLLPKYALGLIGKEAPNEFEDIANHMYIPFDEDMKYHPEFDGYKNGTTVKQADVILMGFPLMCNMTKEVRYNDLAIYEKVTPGGPAMTWGMFAIGWLELKFKDKAEMSFQRGMLNASPPFYIWTENADGTGAVNFETGMGGYLQSLIFGYAGIRLHTDRVQFDPELPPTSTGMRLSGLDYLGSSFDFDYNVRYMHVTLTIMSDVPLYLVTRQHRHELHLKARLTVLRHKFYITPFHV